MKTIRQQIIELLVEQEMSAREISQTVRIREKEVYEHLFHVARSVNTQKKKLVSPLPNVWAVAIFLKTGNVIHLQVAARIAKVSTSKTRRIVSISSFKSERVRNYES